MKMKLFAAAAMLVYSSSAFAASPGIAQFAASCCEALACCGIGLPCCG